MGGRGFRHVENEVSNELWPVGFGKMDPVRFCQEPLVSLQKYLIPTLAQKIRYECFGRMKV